MLALLTHFDGPSIRLANSNMLLRIANSPFTFSRSTIYSVVLVLAAFFFVGTVAPETANASCGDYLVIGDGDHASDQTGTKRAKDASPEPLGSPCNGPQCRQSPGIPSPPLPTEPGPSQHERAHIQRLNAFNLPSPFWYCVAEPSVRAATGFPFRIERPPHC